MKAFLSSRGYDVAGWAYGLIAAGIQGGANAVVNSVMVSAVDPENFALGSSKFFGAVAFFFFSSAALRMFEYLRSKPLPVLVTETSTESTEIVENPPEVKTTRTTITEKRTEPATDHVDD